jgi:hypothetical protein
MVEAQRFCWRSPDDHLFPQRDGSPAFACIEAPVSNDFLSLWRKNKSKGGLEEQFFKVADGLPVRAAGGRVSENNGLRSCRAAIFWAKRMAI